MGCYYVRPPLPGIPVGEVVDRHSRPVVVVVVGRRSRPGAVVGAEVQPLQQEAPLVEAEEPVRNPRCRLRRAGLVSTR